jgi:arginase
MDERKRIAVLGAPLDLGASRRGVDMGPSAMRYADLEGMLNKLGVEVVDCGNVSAQIPEVAALTDEHARYLPEILATCSQLARRVQEISERGEMPLVLGGDHSIAIGTLAGLHAAHGPGGLLWVDAHGDLNRPETSPSGNVHGMPLATALGECGFRLENFAPPPWVDPKRVALVGVRQLDAGEKALIRELGLKVFTMADIDQEGVAKVMREAVEVARGGAFVHLSLDVDVCDPEIAPGVGTPVKGGFSYREAHLAMEVVAEAGIITSMEVVEVNPILDLADATGILANELVASALGARIL